MTFVLANNCRYGLRYLVPKDDIYVGRALLRYGEYSQLELDLLLQFLTPQTRVVVAGGNIGATAIPLAKHCGEVVVFEPQRWPFQLICANATLNGLLNVRAYWAGLSDAPGSITVPVLDPTRENNFGAYELAMGATLEHGDHVPLVRLDDQQDIDCGLLTIDVEGMELNVLRGAEQLIARCRPIIFFEADRQAKNPAVFAWLRQRQYELYRYATPLYNPRNHRGDKENIYMSERGAIIVAENVLAVPTEAGVKLNGFTEIAP